MVIYKTQVPILFDVLFVYTIKNILFDGSKKAIETIVNGDKKDIKENNCESDKNSMFFRMK